MKSLKPIMAPLVAVSALAACAPTFAQSSVQLYGIADAGILYANRVRTGGVGSPQQKALRLESGNAASSRLGFRGRESLGDGLSAVFVLESGVNLDTGTLAQGGRMFGRAAYVGLASTSWGEIQLGRQITSMYEFALVFDPVAPARFATPVFDAAYVGRADDAIKYVGKFGGLNVRAQYSLDYDAATQTSGPPPDYRVGKEVGVHGDYTVGSVTIGAAYDRQNGTSNATQLNKNVHSNVGLAWDIKPVKLYAAYSKQDVTASGNTTKTKLYWLAAQYRPTPPLALTAGLFVLDPDGASNRSTMPTLLATYDLSKRTDLYTQIAFMKNQSAATLGMVGLVNPGQGQTAMTVGIRHRF
jgi:predicted porin